MGATASRSPESSTPSSGRAETSPATSSGAGRLRRGARATTSARRVTPPAAAASAARGTRRGTRRSGRQRARRAMFCSTSSASKGGSASSRRRSSTSVASRPVRPPRWSIQSAARSPGIQRRRTSRTITSAAPSVAPAMAATARAKRRGDAVRARRTSAVAPPVPTAISRYSARCRSRRLRRHRTRRTCRWMASTAPDPVLRAIVARRTIMRTVHAGQLRRESDAAVFTHRGYADPPWML